MKLRIFIDKCGNMHHVYSDELKDLPFGDKKVTRASNVEFNHVLRQWEATDNNGTVIAADLRRDDTIKKEVQVIESRLREQMEEVGAI
jgi:hypothetical protein